MSIKATLSSSYLFTLLFLIYIFQDDYEVIFNSNYKTTLFFIIQKSVATGHSNTMWTRFWLFNTPLPLVENSTYWYIPSNLNISLNSSPLLCVHVVFEVTQIQMSYFKIFSVFEVDFYCYYTWVNRSMKLTKISKKSEKHVILHVY